MPEDFPYSKDDVTKELARFFLEEFIHDPAGVADWVAQGDFDFDEFYTQVAELVEDPKANA